MTTECISLYSSVYIYEFKDMLASKVVRLLRRALLRAKLRMKRIEATKYYYLVENNSLSSPIFFLIYINLEYFVPQAWAGAEGYRLYMVLYILCLFC